MLGAPVNPSQGGKGEILNRSHFGDVLLNLLDISDLQIKKLAISILPGVEREFNNVLDKLDSHELDWWIKWHNDALWGNLDEEIPELTLSTIRFSDRIVNKIVKDENWLSLQTQDVTKAVNEFADFFSDRKISFLVGKSYDEYKSGKREDYLSESDIEIDKEQIKQFKSDIRKEMRRFLSDLDISKPVLEGLRNTIIMVGLLDNREEINDNDCVLTNIRHALANFYRMKLSEFHEILEEKIYQYLEEDLDE